MVALARRVAPKRGAALAALCSALALAEATRARPTAPAVFCEAYPDIPACAGQTMNCDACHQSTYPPSWNSFGSAIIQQLDGTAQFEQALPAALRRLESEDSDGDGLTNLQELELGTSAGDAASAWAAPEPTEGEENPWYRVGGYDPRFAYRRVMILYCGRSPTYEQLRTLDEGPRAASALIHDALEECLQSEHWQHNELPRLADRRIRPLKAAGPDTEVRIAQYRLVIGDYAYDYRLWRYALTADRDMREVLTAQYHVIEDEQGELKKVTGPLAKTDPEALAGGQPLPDSLRAGMLTTQWFLTINTMFSALPRTTAAQAYRAFLGADLSSNDGILPVPGEPLDVDGKGVSQPLCATCHSTLDPLAYAFAEYEGIDIQIGGGFGGYRPQRVTQLMPGWTEPTSVILGETVDSVPEWAQVAANSDQFLRTMAAMFFQHALGEQPGPDDVEEFATLWRSIPGDGYSANRLIHRLVDTQAFGAP